MKWNRKSGYIVLGIIVISILCFVPVVDMDYLVVVEKQYTEPYTVLEEVKEPYLEYPSLESGLTQATVLLRTVTREVTKTRLVTRTVAETRTKRVSILRYLLR